MVVVNHPPVDLPQGVSWLAGPADPRLADYVGLTDVALRRKAEPELGVYIAESEKAVSYTHLRAHETVLDLVCRLLIEKKKQHHHHCRYV